MRSSLQLSDAQNLALQVLLKKMAKAEVQLPVAPPDTFRSKMNESEKQLENLVRELKEMSQIRYPALQGHGGCSSLGGGNGTSSSTSTNNMLLLTPTDLNLEEELQQTSQALGGAQSELRATQEELQATSVRLLQLPEPEDCSAMSVAEARRALEKAQEELSKMR
jgi:hypothetical protein